MATRYSPCGYRVFNNRMRAINNWFVFNIAYARYLTIARNEHYGGNRHGEPGAGVSHGGGRGPIPAVCVWVRYHDTPGTGRIIELGLYLVQPAATLCRQFHMTIYNRKNNVAYSQELYISNLK